MYLMIKLESGEEYLAPPTKEGYFVQYTKIPPDIYTVNDEIERVVK